MKKKDKKLRISLIDRYRKLPFNKKKKLIAYFFLIPWLIGIIVFFLPPLIDTLYSAFFSFSLDRNTGMVWVGFGNFKTLFNPVEPILSIFVSSLLEVLYTIPISLIFSLFIALILNSKFRGRGIVRTIFFLPIVLGLNVINIVLENNPVRGLLDNEVSSGGTSLGVLSVSSLLGFIYDSGIPEVIINPIVSSINSIFSIVTFTGVQILLFLAALQSIDKTLYEVAAIEGCNKYESFWKITLPMVLPAMKIVIVYTIIDAMSRSEIVAYLSSVGMARYSQGVYSATSFMIIIITLLLIMIGILIIPKGVGEK